MTLGHHSWIVVVALSLVTAPLAAGTISFEPAQPTTEDVLRVIYHEEDWSLACEPHLRTVTVRNGKIVITADPPPVCILIVTHNPYTFEVDVGPLPAGTYDVVVETVDLAYEPVIETSEVTVLPAGRAAGPDPDGLGCVHGARPGATLLLPYFEVDLENPEGRDTLFSVNNASGEATVARVVVWTNWGIPVLSFDVALPADGVVPIRLRDVLVEGRLPVTSLPPEADFPGCTDPVGVPTLAEPDLLELTGRLTGVPDPPELCYAQPVEGGALATGFVTVDVVNRCSGSQEQHALADGYFVDGGAGVAGNSNVLWGDFYLIDAAENYAQGLELVSLVADAERFGVEADTFYPDPASNRAPLGYRYRARYLLGGAFTGGTELIAWTRGFSTEPQNCVGPVPFLNLDADFRNQAGEEVAEVDLFHSLRTARFRIGEEPFDVGGSFGTVDVSFGSTGGLTEPFPIAWQGLIVPILSAEGRYSVGLNATQLGGFCP